ncbi:hypothetical protein C2845_PM10G11340 [Panicum miliaceum]|uniref:Uncharacterized protein n=1 Tax=Panicum miliaceum TaxID=4540 RepID=A0A3L6PBZ1_PANMI|nr:hypothetical protein C2845_PM10G11340 [Panicum miliaceum]
MVRRSLSTAAGAVALGAARKCVKKITSKVRRGSSSKRARNDDDARDTDYDPDISELQAESSVAGDVGDDGDDVEMPENDDYDVEMEINFEDQTLEWMTGLRKYNATFAEFAAANQLDYGFLMDEHSNNIVLEEYLSDDDKFQFYEHPRTSIRRVIGQTTGLKHHPTVINKILTVTFMQKGGDKNMVRFKYWNFINHVMFGRKIDVVALMMDQMAEKKMTLEHNIPFGHYVMALIKVKTRFRGACPIKMKSFGPFNNESGFLGRELTPFLEVEGDGDGDGEGEGAGHDGGDAYVDDEAQAMPPPPPPIQPQWAPPAGFFDPYFQNMQQGLGEQMQQRFHAMQESFQGQLSAGFQSFGQQMRHTF